MKISRSRLFLRCCLPAVLLASASGACSNTVKSSVQKRPTSAPADKLKPSVKDVGGKVAEGSNGADEKKTGAVSCEIPEPRIRRLTSFEYNNTIRDVFGDTSNPGNELPPDVAGNGFGNEAATIATSSLHVERYASVAQKVATRVTTQKALWERLHPCVAQVNAAGEAACSANVISDVSAKVYRKPKEALVAPIHKLQELYGTLRKNLSFKQSLAGVIEALLQSSEFLYRPEAGGDASATAGGRKPLSGDEMAVRLSYFFWGSVPDDALRMAAKDGLLNTPAGIRAEAQRMLADPRAKSVLRFFFDQYLMLGGIGGAVRDPATFPKFTSGVGALMREETHQFLEYIFFEGPGDWPSALTAPYTFVNQELAAFYGMPTVGHSKDFRKVDLDTSKRLGLLTHASLMTATTPSNLTNPVRRGAFILDKMLCIHVPFPTGEIAAQITPPSGASAATGRERFTRHSSDPQCSGCHRIMDPMGFPFETYDAIGQHRLQENGVTIDPSGRIPGGALAKDALGIVRDLAASSGAMDCFAENWANYAYGVKLTHKNQCLKETIAMDFRDSNYNLKEYLIRLTQSEYFLTMPVPADGGL